MSKEKSLITDKKGMEGGESRDKKLDKALHLLLYSNLILTDGADRFRAQLKKLSEHLRKAIASKKDQSTRAITCFLENKVNFKNDLNFNEKEKHTSNES